MAPKFKGTELVITGFRPMNAEAGWTLQNYDEYTDHMTSDLIDRTIWWENGVRSADSSILTAGDLRMIGLLLEKVDADIRPSVRVGLLIEQPGDFPERFIEALPTVQGAIREGRLDATDLIRTDVTQEIFSEKTIDSLTADLFELFGIPNPNSAMAEVARGQDPESARKDTQAPPIPNDGPSMHDYVIEEVRKRKELGLREYGTLLQPNNGRDMLQDCLEEIIDLAVYLAGEIHERRELRAERDGLKDELEEALREVRFLKLRYEGDED